MPTYKPKGSKFYVMDFVFAGMRIRKSTKETCKSLADKREDDRKYELRHGEEQALKEKTKPRLFAAAAAEWQELNELKWAPKTKSLVSNSLTHLLPVFGGKLLITIRALDVTRYQKMRLEAGASNRTVNIEVGVLRKVMRQFKAWNAIQDDVEMLEERKDVGVALSPEQESRLLEECAKSRSRSLYPFVVVAVETGMRKNSIRILSWSQVDFANRLLTIGRDKTKASTGRVVPLNSRLLQTLQFWAENFPDRKPSDFVFPAEKVGAAGDDFTPCSYATNPAEPVKNIKEAWEGAKRRAGLPRLRFHDLRHTAITRMNQARIPLPTIGRVVGWAPSTVVSMSTRYTHPDMEEKRAAVEAITRLTRETKTAEETESPQFSPQSDINSRSQRPN
jgi:integrase